MPAASTHPITESMLKAAFEQLRDNPRPPCGATIDRPHVVHPQARGLTRCAECFQIVRVV